MLTILVLSFCFCALSFVQIAGVVEQQMTRTYGAHTHNTLACILILLCLELTLSFGALQPPTRHNNLTNENTRECHSMCRLLFSNNTNTVCVYRWGCRADCLQHRLMWTTETIFFCPRQKMLLFRHYRSRLGQYTTPRPIRRLLPR